MIVTCSNLRVDVVINLLGSFLNGVFSRVGGCLRLADHRVFDLLGGFLDGIPGALSRLLHFSGGILRHLLRFARCVLGRL